MAKTEWKITISDTPPRSLNRLPFEYKKFKIDQSVNITGAFKDFSKIMDFRV